MDYLSPDAYQASKKTESGSGFLDFYPAAHCTFASVNLDRTRVVISSYEYLHTPIDARSDHTVFAPDLKPNARLSLDYVAAIKLYENLGVILRGMRETLPKMAEEARQRIDQLMPPGR